MPSSTTQQEEPRIELTGENALTEEQARRLKEFTAGRAHIYDTYPPHPGGPLAQLDEEIGRKLDSALAQHETSEGAESDA